MTGIEELTTTIRLAWSEIPAPPAEDLKYMAWACGEDAWQAFVNVPPLGIDLSSPAFLGCTPLLDLPPRAAAAYLGTYLLSLLEGLAYQEEVGLFYDVLTRAHVLYCLSDPDFWSVVIRPQLHGKTRAAVTEFASYLVSRHDMLGQSKRELEEIANLSRN